MFALIVLLFEIVNETLCTLVIVNMCHKLVEKQFKLFVILFVKKCVKSVILI